MMFRGVLSLLLVGYVMCNSELKAEKDAQWAKWFRLGVIGKERDSIKSEPQLCVDGGLTVDGETFPCKDVDFMSYVSLQEMEITTRPNMETGIRASDIWGWRSPSTGKEVAMICMDNGMAFVDVTDPVEPCVLAVLPSPRPADTWCDIKVFKDTAYIVKDTRGGDTDETDDIGGQTFNLTRLDDLSCPLQPFILDADHLWDFHGSAHNLVVNTETGFLYSVGGDKCSGGFVVMDLNNDRLKPEFVSCIDGDNYTHDAQCVVYTGPDERYQQEEVCFAFNEEHLVIWQVTDKQNPIMLAKKTYNGQVYTHQGWLNADMSLLLLDDELNELCNGEETIDSCSKALGELDGITKTSTYFVDVSDLENPVFTGTFRHEQDVVDHNLYFWGPIHANGWGGNEPLDLIPNPNYAYLHNYESGLRIFDASSKTAEGFTEIAYFDCAPDQDTLQFLGAWSGYMFPSGTYIVSSVERGLFVLKPTASFVSIGLDDSDGDSATTTALRVIAAGVIFGVAALFLIRTRKKKTTNEEGEGIRHYRTSKNNMSLAEGTGAPPNGKSLEEEDLSKHEL